MTTSNIANIEYLEHKPLHEFSEHAYLDYSMYVILDRALPHIGDGLKPVQRRIIYAMSELGLTQSAKFKKSARTVGDVLGKFHPHGDSACYEAMVLMAQNFSYRYPFVDGQGNWGSPDDPKSFAAMRYTESRLSAYANLMLAEISQGTVDWQANFDGTLEEPKTLPARLPNVLLNGAMGIAVGMATDIPPHNMTEVANACIHVLENPRAKIEDVFEFIQAPDYPSGGEIITSAADIKETYIKGNGSIKMRAVYSVDKGEVIITELPHQVSGAKVLEQIAAQMQAKKLPMVADLRDESDHENPTRLVIIPRSNRVDIDQLMLHLFATTDLERNYRINLNMIGLDGRPRVKNLLTIIKEWLAYRSETVKRRLQFRLDKIKARLHILEGLLIAYLNIDEIIALIREVESPKDELIKRFKLSPTQAEAILEIKLRQLAKLEEIKIKGEQAELADERDLLEKTLGSPSSLKTLIKKEILADLEKYGDTRRTQIVAREVSQVIKEEQMIPAEPITVILSQKGWVRAAKGHEVSPDTLNYKSGDEFLAFTHTKSNQLITFFDSAGRAYGLLGHSLPSARGQGEPLTGRFEPPAGSHFISLTSGLDEAYIVLASSIGYGFITQFKELNVKNRKGKAVIRVPDGELMLSPVEVNDLATEHLAVITQAGRLLLFSLSELPILPKGKGNKLIALDKTDDMATAVVVLNETDKLMIGSGKRHLTLKPRDLASYIGTRGRRGNFLPRGFRKVESVTVVPKS